MRKLLIILLCLAFLSVKSQVIFVNPIGSPNVLNKYAGGIASDGLMALPRGSGAPPIQLFTPYNNAYRAPYIYYDTTGSILYVYNPRTNTAGAIAATAPYVPKITTTVAGLATLSAAPPEEAIVTDTLRGGSFVAVSTAAAPDNGITFASATAGVLWQRMTTQSDWVDVRWFGAKGDGVTVDNPAVQAANDYLWRRGGGMVFFPANAAGKYYRFQRPVLRRDNVGWEGIQDASVIYNDTVVNRARFNGNAVCVFGGYQPSAWDSAQYYNFTMDSVYNTVHIIDSFSRFKKGDVVIITGTTAWANAKGLLKPYVARVNEVDSAIAPDKIILKYSLDTLLAGGKISISGHFPPGVTKNVDAWGNPTYMNKNVVTKNLVLKSEGQWNLGMICLNCSFENLNINAAELFSGNGFAWSRANNLYGTCWKQVTELAIGCHNSTIDGVVATFSNSQNLMKSKGRQPVIKYGENVYMNMLRNYQINANNYKGRGIWFGAATSNTAENIVIQGKQMTNDMLEFSCSDWGLDSDDPDTVATFVSSYVNNNRVINCRFISGNPGNAASDYDNQISYYIYYVKPPISNARLENNRVDNCTFVGPVSPIHSLRLDGYNSYVNNSTLEGGIISYGDSAFTSKVWNCFINGQSVFVQNGVAFDIFKDTRPQVKFSIADDVTTATTPVPSSLSLTALPNTIYRITCNLKTNCTGACPQTGGGILFTVNAPAGSSFKVGQITGSSTSSNLAATMRMQGLGSPTSTGLNRFAGPGNAALVAEITTGLNGGDVSLSFNTAASGDNVSILSGSAIELQEQVGPPPPPARDAPPNWPNPFPNPFPFPSPLKINQQ